MEKRLELILMMSNYRKHTDQLRSMMEGRVVMKQATNNHRRLHNQLRLMMEGRVALRLVICNIQKQNHEFLLFPRQRLLMSHLLEPTRLLLRDRYKYWPLKQLGLVNQCLFSLSSPFVQWYHYKYAFSSFYLFVTRDSIELYNNYNERMKYWIRYRCRIVATNRS